MVRRALPAGNGDRQRVRTPLQPLEVATITFGRRKVPGMTTPQYKFEHNNGMIKPVKLKAIRRDRIPSW